MKNRIFKPTAAFGLTVALTPALAQIEKRHVHIAVGGEAEKMQ